MKRNGFTAQLRRLQKQHEAAQRAEWAAQGERLCAIGAAVDFRNRLPLFLNSPEGRRAADVLARAGGKAVQS
jgi:hypothetical protein